jgi:hypothetical protein
MSRIRTFGIPAWNESVDDVICIPLFDGLNGRCRGTPAPLNIVEDGAECQKPNGQKTLMARKNLLDFRPMTKCRPGKSAVFTGA